jgi:hypothetical protein
MSSFGIYSHIPAHFLLDLEFEKAVNVSESSYEVQSLGHVFFSLAKAEKDDLWLRVDKNGKHKF